jgi:hypothetical protein
MKTLRSILCLSALFTGALFVVSACAPVHAQTAVADSTPAISAASSDTAADVVGVVVKVLSSVLPPKFASVLVAIGSVVGTIGLFTKPIVSAIEAAVRASPSTADDELLYKAEHSRAFKIFAWLLDYFARIKIGPQFTARPQAAETPAQS